MKYKGEYYVHWVQALIIAWFAAVVASILTMHYL